MNKKQERQPGGGLAVKSGQGAGRVYVQPHCITSWPGNQPPNLREPYDLQLIGHAMAWASSSVDGAERAYQIGNMTAAKDLLGVAKQALTLASRAGLLLEACQAAQDLDGAGHWLGMQRRHLAILGAAINPPRLPHGQEVSP